MVRGSVWKVVWKGARDGTKRTGRSAGEQKPGQQAAGCLRRRGHARSPSSRFIKSFRGGCNY